MRRRWLGVEVSREWLRNVLTKDSMTWKPSRLAGSTSTLRSLCCLLIRTEQSLYKEAARILGADLLQWLAVLVPLVERHTVRSAVVLSMSSTWCAWRWVWSESMSGWRQGESQHRQSVFQAIIIIIRYNQSQQSTNWSHDIQLSLNLSIGNTILWRRMGYQPECRHCTWRILIICLSTLVAGALRCIWANDYSLTTSSAQVRVTFQKVNSSLFGPLCFGVSLLLPVELLLSIRG